MQGGTSSTGQTMGAAASANYAWGAATDEQLADGEEAQEAQWKEAMRCHKQPICKGLVLPHELPFPVGTECLEARIRATICERTPVYDR